MGKLDFDRQEVCALRGLSDHSFENFLGWSFSELNSKGTCGQNNKGGKSDFPKIDWEQVFVVAGRQAAACNRLLIAGQHRKMDMKIDWP